MAAHAGSRKRRLGLRFAAWLSLLLGAYAVVGVASLWGLLWGAFMGGLGAIVSLAVLTDGPDARTRRIAKIGLVLGGLAFTAGVVVLVAVALWPWEI